MPRLIGIFSLGGAQGLIGIYTNYFKFDTLF